MDELGYWVALSRVAGVGSGRLRHLKASFGSLERAWAAPEVELRKAGVDERVARELCRCRGSLSPSEEMERLRRHGIHAFTTDDPGYPELLNEAPDCPPVLYVRGALPSIERLLIAVVGTRRPTTYGKQAVGELVDGLIAAGVATVSGLARGIDTMVHRETLERGGTTVAVLAAGLDTIYPSENLALAKRILTMGALVSEYPPGVKLRRENFLRRNRIMSGLSRGTVVIEAGEHSGALATAHYALDQNREVFALPGSAFSPQSRGTNCLIQRGEAKLVQSAGDVLTEFGLGASTSGSATRPHVQVDALQSRLLGAMGASAIHSDELARRLDVASREVSAALTLLELQGVVQNVGGMQYVVSSQWQPEVS